MYQKMKSFSKISCDLDEWIITIRFKSQKASKCVVIPIYFKIFDFLCLELLFSFSLGDKEINTIYLFFVNFLSKYK